MAKKSIVDELVDEVVEELTKPQVELTPLTVDFHREDLNLLRDKINELIARAN